MVDYIEQHWNKANSSNDLSDKLANNVIAPIIARTKLCIFQTLGKELDYIDIVEPEVVVVIVENNIPLKGLQNFATLMEYYEIVTKSIEEQIANKLYEVDRVRTDGAYC